MKKRPEKLGQELFGLFSRTKLATRGSAIREAVCGIGFVDVLVTFSSGLLHIVELKILKGKELPGPAQLADYMKKRQRNEGWLVFFDARQLNLKNSVPASLSTNAGTIRTLVIDINPVPPSRLTD